MGSCFSIPIKAESPPPAIHDGSNLLDGLDFLKLVVMLGLMGYFEVNVTDPYRSSGGNSKYVTKDDGKNFSSSSNKVSSSGLLTSWTEGEILLSSGLTSFPFRTKGEILQSSNSKSFPFQTEGEILQSSNLKSFPFNELKTATRNFRPDSVLGAGGFGSVFKGWIDEHTFTAAGPGTGMVIAVKRLNQEGFQGHKEWLAEIKFLGQLYHPNLVKLIGYCLEDDHRLLVYEFMPQGSLENHLFGRSSYFQPLPWNLRMKVALGAAKGLAYLHGPEVKVIYRDFKTSNILLDSNYDAKLSDFGLAKDGPADGKSHVSTRVMGTYGYAAPEYMATGHLNARSDIYSFGVVLLEMLTGRRVVDKNRPPEEHNLVEWAKPYLTSKRRILHVMDPHIEGQYSLGEALRAASLAIKCLAFKPKFRPTMDDVVKALEELQDLKDIFFWVSDLKDIDSTRGESL